MTTSSRAATGREFTSNEDLSSDEFWAKSFDEREETFGRLRASAPVSWHPPRFTPEVPREYWDPGFWAIVANHDISTVSQHNEIFSSSHEHGRIIMRSTHPDYLVTPTFLEMDPPFHTRYRRIMSSQFTPKAVARLSEQINRRAAQIVDGVAGVGAIDVVSDISSRLPMLTIADLVGVPTSLVERFAEAGDNYAGAIDPDFLPTGVSPLEYMRSQVVTLREIGIDLVHYRRRHPSDDLATALAQAEFDGEPLSDDDIASAMLLLSVAGNDTTKQTTSRTIHSLWRNPDQRQWLQEDFDGRIAQSIEEFVRHASPIIQFARYVLTDTELGGQELAAGDKVVLFYSSGNRDEAIWNEPGRFDLSRPKSGHVAFGGGGVHYCLGNGVAKAQLRALFSQILTKLPHMDVGEPTYLFSDFVNGVKHLPATA